jgi:predicted enzyme related to lactoylglutathione lyase
MPGELVHFDIVADDVAKIVDFYKAVMGWEMEQFPGAEGGMEYWLIKPAGDDMSAVGGGIGKKQMPEQTNINYYNAMGGLEAFNQRVKDKGGKVMMEKMPVPGMGYFSVCVDPEGNAFGGWVEDKEAKM